MGKLLLSILLICGIPMVIAYLYFFYVDHGRRKEKLRTEWREKLRKKEKELGHRMTVEEIKMWLIYEWFKDRIAAAEEFAREISFNLIERK
jgi:hypothetical protein